MDQETQIRSFLARYEFYILACMFAAATTVLLLGFFMPEDGVYFGTNYNLLARLVTFIAGLLMGEALVLLRVYMKRQA